MEKAFAEIIEIIENDYNWISGELDDNGKIKLEKLLKDYKDRILKKEKI